MRCLVIDTSTERGVCAAFHNEKAIFSIHLPFGLHSAQELLPTLQRHLIKYDIDLRSLDHIVVGIGPGSYTGIRVGVTTAKTLAFACKLPLVGVCSLDGFLPSREGDFAAVIDAKIGGVYLQIGKYKYGKCAVVTKPNVYTLSEAAKLLNGVKTIVTPNADKIKPKLDKITDQAIYWEEGYPSCAHLAHVGAEKINAGIDLDFELMYLRKTQAEIERNLS